MSVAVTDFWRAAAEWIAWVVAVLWCWRTSDAVRFMPSLPDLSLPQWDVMASQTVSLTVVVPAKDEAENLAKTLEALLLADLNGLRILVVDDRSSDQTGSIADAYAAEREGKISVIHVTELAEGWLGKTYAMHMAMERVTSEFVLFTDADVLFSPSILRRALAYAVAASADHLVVLPTMQVKGRGEGVVLGFFQIFGLWASRPWRVADETSTRDIVGVGAFNLVRRSAFEELGGWGPQRMAVLEDITLGRRMKAAGMRQRIAFAPGMVIVHWAAGARGLIGVMTKNLFSAFNFNPLLLCGACAWIVLFCLAPLAGLAWWGTLAPSLLVVLCVGATYRLMGRVSQIDGRYGWLYPLGALGFIAAMLNSMLTVLHRGGVQWRGTFYTLADLRQHNSPFVWERAARRRLDDQRRARRLVRRAKKKL